MGFFDFLFGSAPEANIDTKGTLNPIQQQLQRLLQQKLNAPIAAAPGPLPGSSGPSNLQAASLEALQQLSLDQATASGDQGRLVNESLQQLLSGRPDQVFQETVADPLLRSLERDILPINDRKFAKNFSSSDQQRSTENILSRAFDSLAQAKGRFINEDLGRKLQALGIPTDLATKALAAGGIERGITEQGIAGQFDEFVRQQQEASKRINQILQSLGITTQENIATVTGGSDGLLSGLLGSPGAGELFKLIP